MTSIDTYLRHVDKDGKRHVARYRVWDRDRFLKSQLDAAAKEQGRIEPITEAQYEADRAKH
ncbi:hypothetical protein [Nevskia sp.]|uniref:hypothetical protein n=1 Tax=Nevskia sp. TaxID=1929292 RepID=UPI0025D88B6E|nr:hypothetical protein [Nevskia sp.]